MNERVVILDHERAAEALREVATLALRRSPVFVRASFPREETARVEAVMPAVLASLKTYDERRAALESACTGALNVNGQALGGLSVFGGGKMRIMQAAVRLADGLVVESESERRRVCEMLNVDPHIVTVEPVDATIPTPAAPHGPGDAIVIWAPQQPGDVAAFFAIALAEFRYPLLLVSATPPSDPSLAVWMGNEPAAAIARARLIVDTNPTSSTPAAALCARRVPLVCDVESGAQERIDGVRTYDRRRFGSIFEAAVTAIGGPEPTLRSTSRASAPRLRESVLMHDGPLVSIVLPTLDRPRMLRQAVESILNQTYRNLEIIVVVDGGPRLDDLAAAFPTVRFLHMPKNDPLHSSNTAFAETHGEYVAFLNDDDIFFPSHIAELVTALERSSGNVAHGDVLTAFLRGSDDGWDVYGFESNMSRSVDASGFLVSNQIGMTSCMFRRSCIEDGIAFEERVPLYRDYALWLRLAVRNDFIHVDRITSCYTIRNDGAGQQSNMWYDKARRSYEVLYDLYPIPGRPMLEQRRAGVLQSVENENMRLRPEPAGTIAPVPWPLNAP